MDKGNILPVRRSIRVSLLALLLGLTAGSVLIVAFVAVRSISTAGQNALEVGSATLQNQAEDFLQRLTVSTARENDAALRRVQQDAQSVAAYAASLFENPEAFRGEGYWRAADHMFVGPEGQYINGEQDASTVYVPNSIAINDELVAALEESAYLDFVFEPIYENDPNTVAIYIIGEQEFSRLYPNINLGAILPPDFMATEDIFFTVGAPENNPMREVVWTPVYEDPAGQGLLVTAVAPIYDSQGQFLGIIGIDVSLAELSAEIEAASPIAGGYSFLINREGRAIALPAQGYRDILGRSPQAGEFGPELSMASPAFTPILEAMTTGSTGFQLVRLGDEELFVAYSPLENTAWSLANVVRAANMLEAVATLQQNLESSTQTLTVTRILPVGAAILVVALALGLLLTNRLVNPLQKLAMAAQRVGAGEWEAEIPAGGENEVGLVARSFRTMTAQLRDLVSGLEERVSERTQELERRATYLETAATVARDATVMLDPEQLLTRVARQISDRFGFYQVGIFLLDPSGEWAVIAAASSPGGQRMVSRGHRLKVGAEGIVGYVTSTGQPRIALDVGGDAVYFDNPDLPDTRSEMALPLQARGEIIGALDVQSVEEAAFSAEDIAVLQTLADQVALAISNARLYQQSQANLEAIQQAYGEQSRQAWTTMAQTERVQAYRYTQGRVLPADDVWRPEMESALQFGQAMAGPARDEAAESATVALPIQIRDQVIGVLDIRKGGGSEGWTQDEITMLQSLVDQLGVALEGARLYQDTQRRATQERIVGEITARMRESLDMETVLKTATDQIWGALGMSRVEIRLIPEETEE